MNAVAFVPVVRGANVLQVRLSSGTEPHEITLIGSIGKSWWDDTGITEQEFRDALKLAPKGKQVNVLVNSEGGSVKEGLGIYNAIKERNADVQVRITGYALSIASVFPLAAKRSLGGRGVVSPKSAIWMEHKAWSWAQGNADDMRQAADMLETHDETMVDIYAAATGKTKEEVRSRMDKETWTKGADAVAAGLADETDEDDCCTESAAFYRPLPKDYLNRCKAPQHILNALSSHMRIRNDSSSDQASLCRECAEECDECEKASGISTECLESCRTCAQSCRDCATACDSGDMSKCAECATACDDCRTLCLKESSAECKICAEACRLCAESCRSNMTSAKLSAAPKQGAAN